LPVLKIIVALLLITGCARPLRTSVAPLRFPETLRNSNKFGSLIIAADVIDTPEKSNRVSGTDLEAAGILPVHLSVSNKGTQNYEINVSQIFGFPMDLRSLFILVSVFAVAAVGRIACTVIWDAAELGGRRYGTGWQKCISGVAGIFSIVLILAIIGLVHYLFWEYERH
jgi:hypothetical protein